MSQNEKNILLENFLAGALSEDDKEVFEDLVRTDDAFAQEVALRLAEADAFHRARTVEKEEIKKRYQHRQRLRRQVVLIGLGLLGLFWMVSLAYQKMEKRKAERQREVDELKLLQPRLPDTFDIVLPWRRMSLTSPSIPIPCIRDTLWLRYIPKEPIAGREGEEIENNFARGDYAGYSEALRIGNQFLSEHDSVLAKYPRRCLVIGALNICLPEGDPTLAVRYLEVVRQNPRYKTKQIMALLVFAHACNSRCEEARKVMQEENVRYLLPAHLLRWLDGCGVK
ncbi:MAG: hypothetical protein DYG98_12560 [Haliscomenobacteraceae bacterium CHB4]|nr:hypothetical protein [Saprospiraceae bacterium]MCE7923883.1 hypothetical protein [Haliscomenobacteraceae bacterium CHB4]